MTRQYFYDVSPLTLQVRKTQIMLHIYGMDRFMQKRTHVIGGTLANAYEFGLIIALRPEIVAIAPFLIPPLKAVYVRAYP